MIPYALVESVLSTFKCNKITSNNTKLVASPKICKTVIVNLMVSNVDGLLNRTKHVLILAAVTIQISNQIRLPIKILLKDFEKK